VVGYWNSEEVLNQINMSEVWEGETEGDRDPLPWANGHGSRLSDEEYRARAEDLAPNEGAERFHFAPRRSWED